MFFSVACSVRNRSKLSAHNVASLIFCANRTLHGAVWKSNQWARAHHHLLQPSQPKALVPKSVPARALSMSAADPPWKRIALEESDDPEDGEGGSGFGTLSAPWSSRRSYKKSSPYLENQRFQEGEQGEQRGEGQLRVRRTETQKTPLWYFRQCKKLIKANKLQDALDLFSEDMLKGERLTPEEFNYSVLIGGCGRAGFLKKAFQLYNDMKKRGLEASDATYTALFNACAECAYSTAGLQQALKLEQELRRKNVKMSTVTYHSLLKVHAVTNHLKACLHTLREMLQDGHVVTQVTFHYLLMGCVKDKDNGFRLALQIWQQMLKSGILPDSKNYTLLLRVARDCGIGDPALASAVLLRPVEVPRGNSKKRSKSYRNMVDVDVLEKELFIQSESQSPNPSVGQEAALVQIPDHRTEFPETLPEPNSDVPNLLDLFEGRDAGVVSLCAVESISDRLALIGGAQGFLQNMESKGLKPDLKTLTLLADTAEPDQQCLSLLLTTAKKHQITLDLPFFNSAIRTAAKAGNVDAAQAVLSAMQEHHVRVNVQTFGCLAMGCKKEQDALQLLNNMEECGLRPNVHVFSALVGCAARRLDYIYLKKLLTLMKEKEVWPNEVIIRQLEFAAQYPPNYDQYKRRNNYLIHIDGFRGYYREWLKRMPAQTAEEAEMEASQLNMEREEERKRLGGAKERQRGRAAGPRLLC